MRVLLPTLTLLASSAGCLFTASCDSSDSDPGQDRQERSSDGHDVDSIADTEVIPHDVTTGSDDINIGPTCGFTDWPGPDSPKRFFSCVGRARGGFDCSCNGTPISSDAPECERAILDACGVSRSEREYCDHAGTVCWPSSGADQWLCRCDDDTPTNPLVANNCSVALFNACASACENAYGACTPRRDEDWVFDCACTHYPGITRIQYGLFECYEALYRCVPEQGTCSNFAGYCDRRTNGFECGCLDGATSSPSFADLGHDDCREVLTELCGDPGPPPEIGCSDERVVDGLSRTGTCTLLPEGAEEAPGQVYKCSCTWSGPNQSGASGNYSAETECSKALEMCFPE